MTKEQRFLARATQLAHANVEGGGRPFGAAVVKNGEVIATGVNEILRTNDPTADAELTALSTAAIYAELAKPFWPQSMKISYIPVRLESRQDFMRSGGSGRPPADNNLYPTMHEHDSY